VKPGDGHDAFLLRLDNAGNEKQRVRVAVKTQGFSIGTRAHIRTWQNRIALVLNFGSPPGLDQTRKNPFGLPSSATAVSRGSCTN